MVSHPLPPNRQCVTVLEPIPLNDEIEQELRCSEDEGVRCLIPAAEIVALKDADFSDKKRWFNDKCNKLETNWCANNGRISIRPRKDSILNDSVDTVLNLDRKALRQVWACSFQGEHMWCDNSTEEKWFSLVCHELCSPGRGILRKSSNCKRPRLEINHHSGIISPADHLRYFHFMGRIVGKALFDGLQIQTVFVPYLYKFIAGAPITLDDLKEFDQQYYNLFKRLEGLGDNVSDLGLNFTVTERIPFSNETQEIELFRGGKYVKVTEHNLGVYEKALLRYVLFGRIRPQLTELLRGIFEVIPQALLSVFEPFELEILLCGRCEPAPA